MYRFISPRKRKASSISSFRAPSARLRTAAVFLQTMSTTNTLRRKQQRYWGIACWSWRQQGTWTWALWSRFPLMRIGLIRLAFSGHCTKRQRPCFRLSLLFQVNQGNTCPQDMPESLDRKSWHLCFPMTYLHNWCLTGIHIIGYRHIWLRRTESISTSLIISPAY